MFKAKIGIKIHTSKSFVYLFVLGGDVSVTTSGEDRKLFMECSIAGIFFLHK